MPSKTVEFKTYIDRLDYLIGMHYLEVPKEIVQKLGGKLKIRLTCTINGALTFQCGMVALGNGKAYISLNNKRMKELGLKNGDEISVSLKEDKSKYGMEVPQELAELLKQDNEGDYRFHKLPPGKRRYIIYYVSQVKSVQLRIDRAIKLIENLKKLPEGKEDFRRILGIEKE